VDIVYRPHKYQQLFHLSKARIRGLASGRRGGKTNAGVVEFLMCMDEKRGFKDNGRDPYIGVVMAPTTDMMKRVNIKMIMAYGSHMIESYNQTSHEMRFYNGAVAYGISADRPQRLEGIKANVIYLDEWQQLSEQVFLEALARVSDTQGLVFCTGSLGTTFNNPKSHWFYKHMVEKPIEGSECFEFTTADNPYFPREELERLKDTLDPRTYRQMFEIDWNAPGTALVYDEFDEGNLVKGYVYRPELPTYVSLDFGWTHPMAALFIQYDPSLDRVYVFDEIVKSKLSIDSLYSMIMKKNYRINEWICDIAGNQEREQTGISNVQWFREKGIRFSFRTMSIQNSIAIVRSYIKNTKGQARLFIDEAACPKLIDGMRNYSYPEKAGTITNENPIKEEDDAVDALRYYFGNKHDTMLKPNVVGMVKR
jgi:hypothetical protein